MIRGGCKKQRTFHYVQLILLSFFLLATNIIFSTDSNTSVALAVSRISLYLVICYLPPISLTLSLSLGRLNPVS